MSRPPTQSPPPRGPAPLHVVQVLGEAEPFPGAGAHVRALAAGLVAHGLRVTVYAPRRAEARHDFTGAGARFVPARGRTRSGPASGPASGLAALARLAALRTLCADAGLVHAHGTGAGLLAALALGGRRRAVPLVLTLHGPPASGPPAPGASARSLAVRVLERRAARVPAVVLGATTALVDLARAHGARDARLAPVALPSCAMASGVRPAPPSRRADAGARADADAAAKTRAEIGAVDRPLLFAVGRLEPVQGYCTALTAARAWRALEPPPLLAIAGEGPQRAALQARIDAETLPVRLLGSRDDAFDVLAIADIAVLAAYPTAHGPTTADVPAGDAPAGDVPTPDAPMGDAPAPGAPAEPRQAGTAPLARAALRAGVPLVATAVGSTPELVGDAGLLVPSGDPDALATAVTGLLADPRRRLALAAAGRARAAAWPTEEGTLAQVLSVYDELARHPAR